MSMMRLSGLTVLGVLIGALAVGVKAHGDRSGLRVGFPGISMS